MKIYWTKKALNQLDELENFLLANWFKKSVRIYFKKLERTINQLQQFPNSGIKIDHCRRINVTSQTALIYTFIPPKQLIILNKIGSSPKDKLTTEKVIESINIFLNK